MEKNTHKKVTLVLTAGLLATNRPIPMVQADGFERDKYLIYGIVLMRFMRLPILGKIP
ncbi:MAG: hypothetical protein K2P90_04330 [Holosporales bacterium]|nr:hypothetical protein [Holosporales bacterium]